MSSAITGHERASFIEEFLAKVMPSIYRFGNGDVTDAAGNRSGQLDVVIEHPFTPSLPTVDSGQTRLYLAESAAAVIEVKSNLSNQWAEAAKTAKALSSLKRSFGASISFGNSPTNQTPLFAVGYTGWSKVETLQSHVDSDPYIYGALVIDAVLYVSKSSLVCTDSPPALWGLITDLHQITNSLQSAPPKPLAYAM